MTPRRLIPLMLLAVAAGCSKDAAGPAPCSWAARGVDSTPEIPQGTICVTPSSRTRASSDVPWNAPSAANAQSSAAAVAPGANKVIASMPAPSMDEIPGCGHLTGTVYGHYEAGTGWVGDAQVSIGGGTPEHATFVDAGTDELKGHVNGNDVIAELQAGKRFWGTEKLTLTFSDGTLAEDASFVGVPASTPYLYELHETGSLSGTGRFEGASGHVAVDGPFLNPVFISPPPWIASITGSVCM